MPVSSPVTHTLLPSKYSLWATFCHWLPHTCSQERQFTAINCTPKGNTQVTPFLHHRLGPAVRAQPPEPRGCGWKQGCSRDTPGHVPSNSPTQELSVPVIHTLAPKTGTQVFFCLSLKKEKGISVQVAAGCWEHSWWWNLPRGWKGELFICLFITISQLAYLFYHQVQWKHGRVSSSDELCYCWI